MSIFCSRAVLLEDVVFCREARIYTTGEGLDVVLVWASSTVIPVWLGNKDAVLHNQLGTRNDLRVNILGTPRYMESNMIEAYYHCRCDTYSTWSALWQDCQQP